MNLIVLSSSDFIGPTVAELLDVRRVKHIREIHRPAPGDWLKVGLIDGRMGKGQVAAIGAESIRLEQIELTDVPPPALPLTLILALPRPRMLQRTLQTITAAGVKTLYLIHSRRVEKSYWQTPCLTDEAIHQQLILGLEQGADTRLPVVHLRRRFRPFIEDEVPSLVDGRQALVAHPYTSQPCPAQTRENTVLAVGPEGGFVDYEVDKLKATGFQPVHLGPRILRVETAIPYLLGRLF